MATITTEQLKIDNGQYEQTYYRAWFQYFDPCEGTSRTRFVYGDTEAQAIAEAKAILAK